MPDPDPDLVADLMATNEYLRQENAALKRELAGKNDPATHGEQRGQSGLDLSGKGSDSGPTQEGQSTA